VALRVSQGLRRDVPLLLPGREHWLPLAALAALPLLLFRNAVFRGEAIYERDVHLDWYTQVESLVRTISSGWPLWDPSFSFGQPLLGDPSAQVAYPPTWLNLVLRPWTYYTLLVVSHLAASAAGMYLLGRRLGLGAWAGFMAGAMWVLTGPTLSLVNLWHHFTSATWMPWVLLAAERALVSRRPRDGLLWGAAMAAQILAGSSEVCAMTGLLAALAACAHFQWRSPLGPVNRRLVLVALLGSGFALALSAVQWLATLEVAQRSARWEMERQVRTYWSVHPLRLVQLVWPVSWNDLPMPASRREELFEGREPFLFSHYLGLPALGLASSCALSARRRAAPLGVVLAGALLMAMGRHGFVYDAVIGLAPPLGLFRYPEKVLTLAGFAWALLAAFGFEVWLKPGRPARGWSLAVVGPLALGVAGSVALVALPADAGSFLHLLAPQKSRVLMAALAALGVLIAALLRRRRESAGPALAASVAGLVVVDLMLAAWFFNPTAPKRFFQIRPPTLDVLRQDDHRRIYVAEYLHSPGKSRRLLGRDEPYEVARLVERWDVRASAALAMRLYLVPPAPGAWGLESSYEADARGMYPRYLSMLTQLALASEGSPEFTRLLQIGAVGRAVSLHPLQGGLLPLGTFDALLREPVRTYSVPDPRPRAYVVGSAFVASDREALSRLVDRAFDPAREIAIATGPAARASPAFSGSCRIEELVGDRVRLQADLSEPGYVVLVDAFDPGWRAWVDGRPEPVLRANVAFRALRVPAGRHAIEYRYRPTGVLTGLALSSLALMAGVFVGVRAPRRRAPGAYWKNQ